MAVPAYQKNKPPNKPLKFKTPEDLEERINNYFNDMTEQDRPLTMSGLAVYLDCDRRTLVNYSKREAYFPTIKKARQIVEAYAEEKLISTSGIAAGIIFSLKNNFGWEDKREVDMNHNIPKPLLQDLPEPKRVEVIEVVDKKPKAKKPKEIPEETKKPKVDLSQIDVRQL